MAVDIDFAIITALRVDYKRQKVVITVECGIGKDVMKQMPEISHWAAYDQPVQLSFEKVQQEMPWAKNGAASA